MNAPWNTSAPAEFDVNKPFSGHSVPMSSDLARVIALPRRVWSEDAKQALAVWLTDQLRTSQNCDKCNGSRAHKPWILGVQEGCWYTDPRRPERARIAPPLALRGVQAVVLYELYIGHGQGGYGVYMQVPVGGGKTLIFFLAGLMTSAKRGLLFVPASIKADVEPAWNLYTKYWRAPYPLPRVESFQQLTHFGSVDMLEMMRPDLLLGDECDKAKDLSRSAGKRIGRYVDLVRGECTLLFGSGTNKRKSLRDDNHFMTWCLRERTPGFLTDEGLSNACLALDEESKVGAGRLHPGALLDLADQMGIGPDNPDAPSMGMLARARNGYRLRVEQTPGIVIHDQSECDQPITIDFVLPEPDPEIERWFEHFRMTSKTPETDYAGEAILMPDALTRHRHAQELGSGFFLYWDPRPPAEWLAKRKAWNQFVADEIYTTANCPHQCRHVRCTQRPLDTPLAVENAHPAEDTLLAWREVRDRAPKFEPNSVPGWLSYSVIKSVAKFVGERWTSKGDTGIIWVKHVAFANVLSQATGIPYYGAKGERVDQYGRSVAGDTIEKACQEAAKAGRMAPVAILSLDANLRGRNLQAYANNLNVGWEPAGTRVEQRLGRTHRSGQTRPVTDTIMVTCGEVLDSFQKTLSEARFVKSQGLTHKILTARIDRSGLRAYPKDDFRYVRRET